MLCEIYPQKAADTSETGGTIMSMWNTCLFIQGDLFQSQEVENQHCVGRLKELETQLEPILDPCKGTLRAGVWWLPDYWLLEEKMAARTWNAREATDNFKASD